MVMKTGERWHCMNPNCRSEVLIVVGGDADRPNPVCSCGSPMKKAYKPPVLRYLDFLHLDEPEFVPRDHQDE
jgi:hypothetical protein